VTVVGAKVAVEDGLHQRTQRKTVVGGDEVNGVAHQRDAYRAPVGDQRRQFAGMEVFQPRPHADIGRVWRLSLHADEVFERLSCGQFPAAQQHLAFQKGAVERAYSEDLGIHRRRFTVISFLQRSGMSRRFQLLPHRSPGFVSFQGDRRLE